MFKSLFLPIILVALLIIFTGLLYQGKLTFLKPLNTPTQTESQTTKTIFIEDTKINVETAKTNTERAKGLSGRNTLPENSGMLFFFTSDTDNKRPNFWMKDTLIPLDILWIKDNNIVKINENVPTEPGIPDSKLKMYPAPEAIDYVLEVNAGFCAKNNIKAGQKISGL